MRGEPHVTRSGSWRTGLSARGELSPEDDAQIEEQQRRRVERGRDLRDGLPCPQATLAHHVYADPKFKEQFARMRPGSPFGEDELVFDRGLTS